MDNVTPGARHAKRPERAGPPSSTSELPIEVAHFDGSEQASIAGSRAMRGLGVYVHFPWCLKKCPYCDFLSIASPRSDVPHAEYADAVIREIEARLPGLESRPLVSVFFGGGTPSLWEPAQLGRVLERILGVFGVQSSEVEVTAE